MYLGKRQTAQSLLVTDRSHAPVAVAVGFAVGPVRQNSLTLAMSSRVALAGSLPKNLPWIIAALGTSWLSRPPR